MSTTAENGTKSDQQTEPTQSEQFYRPNVDIVETPEELTVWADMPGSKSEKIDIDFEDGHLTIRARVEPRQTDTTSFLRQEFGVGSYYRTFQLPETIDASRICAEYRDGVLTLHLPKAESAKPRKIAVQNS